jgi:hypothetical protein
MAVDHDVMVLPVTGAGPDACAVVLADELGAGTGGRAWHRQSGATWAEIGAAMTEEIALRSLASCGVCDADGDGIPSACECPVDLDCDGAVGVTDFLEMLAAWGGCPPMTNCPADLDGDGSIGITDFLDLLAAWGPCP